MRKLAIALLTDDHGISFDAWLLLMELLTIDERDIMSCVKITDGRAYLPTDAVLISR